MSKSPQNKNSEVNKSAPKNKLEDAAARGADYKSDKKFQNENLAKEQARQVTPAGKARSK
jgi:hypothetical protein